MSNTRLPASIVVGFLGVAVAGMSAQSRPAPTFGAIVVFHDGASFEGFQGAYRADDRASVSPQHWDYLDRGVAGAVQTLERAHGFRARQVYSHAVRGFAADLTARQMVELENDARVDYVEPDVRMEIVAQVLPWGINKIDADLSSTLAGNGSGAVSNVHVYVIDTGVDSTHPDLNVIQSVNFATGTTADCSGHGTHVAGTIAARDNAGDVVGVAPGAPITSVKVLPCSGAGNASTIIKGVDWVTAHAHKPAVANMSLGGTVSAALDAAVRKSVDSGVVYAIAAGNSGIDACTRSPSRVGTYEGVITTAATNSLDQESPWSSYGACVDVWAPGTNIVSTKLGGGTTTLTGTSMASPHAAGTAALFLSGSTTASPAQVESALKTDAVSPGTVSKDGRPVLRISARWF